MMNLSFFAFIFFITSTGVMSGFNSVIQEPIYFIANKGQWDEKVKFIATINGAKYWFMNDGFICQTLVVNSDEKIDNSKEFFPNRQNALRRPEIKSIKWTLENVSKEVQIIGLDTMPHYSNYFIGNKPEKWRTEVPHFKAIFYSGIYPDIDLKFYACADNIKYDFIVKPGADPSSISIRYSEIGALNVSEDGKSVIVANGNLHNEFDLLVYQVRGGKKIEIDGRFKISNKNSLGFEIGEYDKSLPLIIDPRVSIIYSTYLGGSSYESGNDVVVDTLGCAYVTGYTLSTNFPLQNPYQNNNAGGFDVFVSKFSYNGNQLLYSTYLGGTDEDVTYGIAIDSLGNIYIAGRTSSTNFPVINYYQQYYGGGLYDAFVTKISASGTQLLFSTYLGGSGDDQAMDIAVDPNSHCYVVGKTSSTNFPLRNPLQPNYGGGYFDCFITKFLPSGNQLAFSTYLGGSVLDEGWGLALDSANNIYTVGYTSSPDFPVQDPFQPNPAGANDGFVTKLSAAGNALIYSTYFGGELYDYCQAVCVDRFGHAYVTGGTESDNFPIYNPYQNIHYGVDAFVSKFSVNGTNLVFSTFLGGTSYEYGQDIAVDSYQCVYVTGYTGSGNFPLRNAFQNFYGGGYYDGFITKFVFAGNQLSYSSYLGGNSDDVPYGLAIDQSGCAYVTGNTLSSNFPVMNPFQGIINGPADAFLTKLSMDNTGYMEMPAVKMPVLFNIQPSIVYDIINMEIKIPQSDKLVISVLDVNGGKITEICPQNINPDRMTISWSAKDLPAGIYFIKIDIGRDYSGVRKFVKLNN
ncbi:MAG: SBBP repeat-containing protein [candidate division WOR-3 bacterium]